MFVTVSFSAPSGAAQRCVPSAPAHRFQLALAREPTHLLGTPLLWLTYKALAYVAKVGRLRCSSTALQAPGRSCYCSRAVTTGSFCT